MFIFTPNIGIETPSSTGRIVADSKIWVCRVKYCILHTKGPMYYWRPDYRDYLVRIQFVTQNSSDILTLWCQQTFFVFFWPFLVAELMAILCLFVLNLEHLPLPLHMNFLKLAWLCLTKPNSLSCCSQGVWQHVHNSCTVPLVLICHYLTTLTLQCMFGIQRIKKTQ